MNLIKIEIKFFFQYQNYSKIKNINDDKMNNQSSLFENNENNSEFKFFASKNGNKKSYYQRNLNHLGFYISNHPLNEYEEIFNQLKNNFLQSIFENDKNEGLVAGTIMSIQEKKVQKERHMQL